MEWFGHRALPSVCGTTAEASRLAAVRLTSRRTAVGSARLKLVRRGARGSEQVNVGAAHLLWWGRPWLSAGGTTRGWRRCGGGGGGGVDDRDAGPRGKFPIRAIVLIIGRGGGGEQRSFRREHGSREIGARLLDPARIRSARELGEAAAKRQPELRDLLGRAGFGLDIVNGAAIYHGSGGVHAMTGCDRGDDAMLGQHDCRFGGDAGARGRGVDNEDQRLVQRIDDLDFGADGEEVV